MASKHLNDDHATPTQTLRARPADELAFPENVQRRPGMFIGDIDGDAVDELVFELLANAVDEHLSSYATSIDVTVTPTEATVADNGRGLRFDAGGAPTSDVFTSMHRTGTRDGHSPHVHLGPGLRGVGLAIVCALCERVVAESCADGALERRTYSMGRSVDPPALERTQRRGTTVRIVPSKQVFARAFRPEVVAERMRELSFMLPGCTFSLNGVAFAGGTSSDFCAQLASDQPLIAAPLHVRLLIHGVVVDVAVGWRRAIVDPVIVSFVSAARTRQHGTHVDGLFLGLKRGLAQTAHRASARVLGLRDLRARITEGLVAVVHAGLYAPRFGDPTKDRLENPEARKAVAAAVALALPAHLLQHPVASRHIGELLA